MKSLVIRQVEAGERPHALRLLAALNPDVDPQELERRMADIVDKHDHYELYGAFEGEEMVAVCGAWVATKLWCGHYLEIDNIARERDCQILALDSYASNTSSHRLYHRLGYEIKGFHFVKALGPVLNPARQT